MLSICLFDDVNRWKFSPLSATRAVCMLRTGAFTLLERVQRIIGKKPVGLWTADYLATAMHQATTLPCNARLKRPTLLLSGRALWRKLPAEAIGAEPWVACDSKGEVLCVYTGSEFNHPLLTPEAPLSAGWNDAIKHAFPLLELRNPPVHFQWPWQLIHANAELLKTDWETLDNRGFYRSIDRGVHLLNSEHIHIGNYSRVMPGVVIDAEEGPVIIAENVKIMPHCFIQGPAYIGPGSLVQTGSVLRGGVSLGPVCKVGGEVEGSIIQGYSNKQHDGFLGHSYIGSWVNIAADCINSDLKNTYGTIRMPINGTPIETGERFLGMLVGDHSKIGINCSIPTGAVIGVSSNVMTPRAPLYVPSFTWINDEEVEPYILDKALIVAERVMERRKVVMTEADRQVLRHLHQQSVGVEAEKAPARFAFR